MAEDTRLSDSEAAESKPGPFLAKIVSHLDPTYMGVLEVQLLREVGNDDDTEGQLRTVKYLSPFYGVSSIDFVGDDPDDYNNTQKSYGMWMVPPDVGTLVLCLFVDGDPRKGYWIGCVPDENMNFMVPGNAATKFVVDETKETEEERVPVAEYNKVIQGSTIDPTKILKPETPFAKILQDQGLLKDDIRGITSSSARREIPSAVFGISTPGPVDKQPGAKKGKIGKKEHRIANAFVSRLGGSSFVMDDGDDKFLRKKSAGEGPPEYVAVEQDEEDGDVTIPHNELIRLRTRTGHQILLHNSEDLIYIGNARGTTWIELTSNGKIDIYAKDSVSIHTQNDLNVTADRDINFTAGRNINLNAGTDINQTAASNWNVKIGADGKLTAGGALDLKSGADTKLTAGGGLDIKSGGASKWTAGGDASIGGANLILSGGKIDLNGPAAPTAAAAADAPAAAKANRIPQHEPWNGHENLDPLAHKPTKTEAVAEPKSTDPEFFEKYTTSTDTFEKLKGPEEEENQEE